MAVTPLPQLADPKAKKPGPLTLAQVRSLLDANNALTAAQQNVATQAETGSTFSRRIAQVQLLKAQEAVKGPRAATPAADPKKKAAAPTEPFKSPVVSVADATAQLGGTAGAGVPTAPTAVTDPQSQISPEEQAARERARLLLMNYGGRAGRVSGASTGTLGFRTLMGA